MEVSSGSVSSGTLSSSDPRGFDILELACPKRLIILSERARARARGGGGVDQASALDAAIYETATEGCCVMQYSQAGICGGYGRR